MDCATSMVKYMLFVINTIVSIIGILGIVYGVIILQSIGRIAVNGMVSQQALMPIAMIILCSIMVFITFLGCCGAIRESVCMTMSYAVCLLVLLILQLIIVVMLYTNKEMIIDATKVVLEEAWMARKSGIFDVIQTSFKCCGLDGPQDYGLSLLNGLPSSCCNASCINPLNIYGGCSKQFVHLMSENVEHAKFFGLGLLSVELIGFIFACCLANNVRIHKHRNGY